MRVRNDPAGSVSISSAGTDVVTTLGNMALERRIRLLGPDDAGASVSARILAQVRMALTCLVRNAIEATPVDGWTTVRVELPEPDQAQVVIEDSGPGPDAVQREHMFDPFYSGRAAGRGRGLGLPTAWRLACQHGGDVRFVPVPGGPTRFVLTLPVTNDAPSSLPIDDDVANGRQREESLVISH